MCKVNQAHFFFFIHQPLSYTAKKRKNSSFFSSNRSGIKSFTETTCIQRYYTICSAEHKENNVNSGSDKHSYLQDWVGMYGNTFN